MKKWSYTAGGRWLRASFGPETTSSNYNVCYRSMAKVMKHKLQSVENKTVYFILKYEPITHLMYSDFVTKEI